MNVSSVKNLNGETFSAVQDAALTDVVQTNSGNWQDITAYQNASAGYLTAHQSLANYYTTADANTMSGMLSGAIDYVSANAGGGYTESAYYITYGDQSFEQTALLDALTANRPIFLVVTSATPGTSQVKTNCTIGLTSARKLSDWSNDYLLHFNVMEDGTRGRDYSLYVSEYTKEFENSPFTVGQTTNYNAGFGLNLTGVNTFNVDKNVVITTAASSVSLPSANFEIDSSGQAYKLDTTTAEISVTPTAQDQNLTEFAIGDLGKYIYTTNVSNGRWQLDGGAGESIVDNTINLSDISDDVWSNSTKLQINDYTWPPQVATLTYTSTTFENIPYLLSGQGGGSNPEVESYVVNNSATIDDTVTAYQTNSSTYLTAHQAISAEEWNSNYDTVISNSGAWGGNALPVSAGQGVKINLVDNTLVFSNDETVLYSSTGVRLSAETTLSEPGYNFEKIEFWWGDAPGGVTNYMINEVVRPCDFLCFMHAAGGNNVWQQWGRISADSDFSKIIMDKGKSFNYGAATSTAWSNPTCSTGVPDSFYCYKIVGINRIAGGN